MWIIGGLVVGLWFLLMWRLTNMETSRKELRESIREFFGRFEEHTKEDAVAFKEITAGMNKNHIELLGMLGSRRGDR